MCLLRSLSCLALALVLGQLACNRGADPAPPDKTSPDVAQKQPSPAAQTRKPTWQSFQGDIPKTGRAELVLAVSLH